MVTVESILGGTFRFVRANIPSIAIWIVLCLILGIVMRVAMAPVYHAQAAASAAIAQGLPPVMPSFGPLFLAFVPMMLALLVLYNAVFRAVLFPADRRAAYLRIGMDEFRLFGLMLVLFAIMVIGILAFGIVVGILWALLSLAAGMGRGSIAAIIFLLFAVIWVATIFLSVRMSVAAPLTLQSREIAIGSAWRLTRGRFWTLFGAYLVVAIGLFVLTLLMMLPTMRAMMAAMGSPGDLAAAQRLAEVQAQQMRLDMSPLGIIRMIVNAVLGGVMIALVGGLPAVATAQLLDEQAGRL